MISIKYREKNKLPPCVIMAGGMGKRLGKITKSTPKPAIKINKIPYIIYLIKWLKKNGFKKFYFLLSFEKNKLKKIITEYFNKNKNLSFKIYIDKKRSGTYGALLDHINQFEEKFFYTNGDEIGRFNIKKMYKDFLDSKTKIMSCVIKSKHGNFNLDKKKRIISENGQKKFKDCGYKFMYRKIFNKKNKKYIKVEEYLYQNYIKKNKISYFELDDLPLRIDTAYDIKRTKLKL